MVERSLSMREVPESLPGASILGNQVVTASFCYLLLLFTVFPAL